MTDCPLLKLEVTDVEREGQDRYVFCTVVDNVSFAKWITIQAGLVINSDLPCAQTLVQVVSLVI